MSLPQSGMLSPTTQITPLGNVVPTSITPETVEDFVPEDINIVSPLLDVANASLDITIKTQKLRLRNEISQILETGRELAEQEFTDPERVEAVYGTAVMEADKLIAGVNVFDRLDLKALRDERVRIHTSSHIGPRKVGILQANAKAARIKRREDSFRLARTAQAGADGKWTLTRAIIAEGLENLGDEVAGGLYGEDQLVIYGQEIVDSVWANSVDAFVKDEQNGKKRFTAAIDLLSKDPEVLASMTVTSRVKLLKEYEVKRSQENYFLGLEGIYRKNPSALGQGGLDLFEKMEENGELLRPHYTQLVQANLNAGPDPIEAAAQARAQCEKLGKSWWNCMSPSATPKENRAVIDTHFKSVLDTEMMRNEDMNIPPPNPWTVGMDFIERTGTVPTHMANMALEAGQPAPGKATEQTIAGLNSIIAIQNEQPEKFEDHVNTAEEKTVVRLANQFMNVMYGKEAFADHPSFTGLDPQGLVTWNLKGVVPKMTPATALAIAQEELGAPTSPGAHDRDRRARLKGSIGIDAEHPWTGELKGSYNQSLAMTLGVKNLKDSGIDVGSLDPSEVKTLTTQIMTESVELMMKYKMRPESAFREAGIAIAASGWGNSSINFQHKDSDSFFQEAAEIIRGLGGGQEEVIQNAIDNKIFESWSATTIHRNYDNRDIKVGNGGMAPHRASMALFMMDALRKTENGSQLDKQAIAETIAYLQNDHAFLAGGYFRVKAEDVEKNNFVLLDNGLTADNPYWKSLATGLQKSVFGAINKRDVNIRFTTPDPDQEFPESSQYLLDPSKAQQWVAVQPDPSKVANYQGEWTFVNTPDYSTNERAIEVLANISRRLGGLTNSKNEGEWWTIANNLMGSGGGQEYNSKFEFHFGGDDLVRNGGQLGGEMHRPTFPMSMDYGPQQQRQILHLANPGKYSSGFRYDPTNYRSQLNTLIKERIPVEEQDFDTQEEKDEFQAKKRLQEAQMRINAVELHRANNTNALWSTVKDFPIVGGMTPQQVINSIRTGDATNTIDEYGNQY